MNKSVLTPKQRAFCRKLAAKLRRLRHEEHYNQESWGQRTACGTAACVAGHAVTLDGWKLHWNDEYNETANCVKNGRGTDIRSRASHLLGECNLSFDLFTAAPSLEDEGWPEPYRTRWIQGHERKSRIAADLLDAIADGTVR